MTSKRQAELEAMSVRLVADLRARPLEPEELAFLVGHIAVENFRAAEAIANMRWAVA